MEHTGWLLGLLLIFPLLFVGTGGDFSSGAYQAVRCLLAQKNQKNCATLSKVIVPSYLVQAYNDSPTALHDALRSGSLGELREELLTSLPLCILYLIPRARLADLNGYQLGVILQKHSDDTSLVQQISASLHNRNNLFQLIKKLQNVSLSEDALQILAESVEVPDITREFLALPFLYREPLMAYLRPAVLFNVDSTTLYSLMILLQVGESSKLPKKTALYYLSEAVIRQRAPISKLRGFVMGLSPDQLLNDTLTYETSAADFRLELSILQARALFERTYQNTSLSSSNFIDSKPLLFKLSPELLQRFPKNVQNYDVNFIDKLTSIPLPTACQITAYVKADCVLTRKLPETEDEFWGSRIRYIGQWVYTLSLSALEDYKHNGLGTAVLKSLDFPAISPMQAYYLTGMGESLNVQAPNSLLELEAFLHALPASQLVNRKIGEISSHVLLHLVSKLPAGNLPRTLSLANKIVSSIGDKAILEELLENNDINQIITLISPKDLLPFVNAMLKVFAEKEIKAVFGSVIEQLPQHILAALLENSQQSSQWRWSSLLDSSHVSYFLVGGLTCHHIEQMDTGLFIPIMSRYNTVRKKDFPKNLQHCCLQKLINHLKLKMVLTQTDPDDGLISLLEPIEIESVKGYILVKLPLEAIKVSPYLGYILAAIGRLSSAELMLSSDISDIQNIAELAVDKERSVNTFLIRNLVWFLPSDANTPDLKLMLEAQLLDTTICLPAEVRRHIASRLIVEFGPPKGWTAAVLAALQDLLIVFSEGELRNVSTTAWTKAADSLKSHYNDLVDWIQPKPFYQLCADNLGKPEEIEYKNAVRRYVQWQLKAAQWLLNTVQSVSEPEVHEPLPVEDLPTSEEDQAPETAVSVFNPNPESVDAADDEEYDYEEKKGYESTSKEKDNEKTTTKSVMEEVATTQTTHEIHTTVDNTVEQISYIQSTTDYITTRKTLNTDVYEVSDNLPLNTTTEHTTTIEHNSVQRDNIHTTEIDEEGFETDEKLRPISTNKDTIVPKGTSSDGDEFPHGTSTNEITNNNYNGTSDTPETSDTIETNSLSPANEPNHSAVSKAPVNGLIPDDKTEKQNKNNGEFNEMPTNVFNKDNNSIPSTANATKNTSSERDGSVSTIIPNTTNFPSTTKNPQSYNGEPIDNGDNNENDNYDEEEDIAAGEFTSNNENSLLPDYTERIDVRNRRSIFSRNSHKSSDVQLSCNAIKMVGSLAGLALTGEDIEKMSDTEIADCIFEFGTMELSVLLQKELWKRIEDKKKQAGIHLFGSLLRQVSVADLWDMEFRSSHPWSLETISALTRHVNNTMVREKVMKNVVKENLEFPPELLAVLGPSVCSLHPDSLRALTPVGLELGTSCPPCLPYLAQRTAEQLTSVDVWPPHFIHAIQTIAAGLDFDSWKRLAASPYRPLSALQPSAAKCLNTSHLKVLSADQIRMIPALTLLALSEKQLAVLNTTQLEALRSNTHPSVTEKMTPSKRIFVAGVPGGDSNCLMASTLLVLLAGILSFLRCL